MQTGSLPPGYPHHRVVDVGLRDGSTIRVRPVTPDDLYDVVDLFERLSDESQRMRWHGSRHASVEDLRRFVEVDYRKDMGLVAETSAGDEPRVMALANYVSTREDRAEMAVVVDDPFHGRGVASILIEHLSEAAVDAGIITFEAEVLSGNSDMLEVIRNLQLPVVSSISSGVVHVEFPTSPTKEALEAFEQREAVAAAAAVEAFLKPRSVAVIGASRRPGTVSAEVFRNLIKGGFNGPVYPVNPNADVVQSVVAYDSVLDIPGPLDLAVVVVPAPLVEHAAAQCGEKGVKGLLVISAGFSETGGEGTERQRRLMDIARRYGMRVIGPNCMGIMNTQPEISLDATFSPVAPDPGTLAFSSQSGALGIAVIEQAKRLGLGISSFVSVGNKADISGNDLLQYWEQDSNTEVILLYLESFGNPRKFARIARRIARRKPIVAVKSGRSEAGARAAASHTGSLVAGDIAVDALFRQAGVVRTDTLEELFDVARVFADQPAPEGSNVGILTNAGGLGILCADACEAAGLRVPQLSDRTQEALKNLLPAEAGISNPVDMIASATPEQYGAALRLLLSDDDIDSVIVIFISPLVTRGEDVADAVVEAVRSSRSKTVLTCFLGSPEAMDRLSSPGVSIPAYSFPESAARALGRVTDYARWKAKPDGDVVVPEGIDRSKAAGLCAGFLEDGGRWLTPLEVSALLECYGIPHVRTRTARDPEEVERAAAELSFPVAVKIDSRSILHKTDVGGVRLDLDTPAAAGDAARAIVAELERRNIADELDGFVVQEMVTGAGAEMFLGMTHDPLFGPLLACGAGGTLVELIRDVTVRISPLTDVDAQEMLRSLKTYPLFEGYRGQPPLDRRAMEELLLRLSAMVEDLALLSEIDFNPVLVSAEGKGCTVVDARIRISTPAPQPPRGARTVT